MAQREGLDAFGLVERIRNFERSLHDAGLDGGAIVAFVAAMPQEDQRVVFEGLKSHRASAAWSEVLANAHSDWFGLHQRLARKWDQPRYAENCRAHIGQDWTLARPLVSGQIRRKAYSEALVLIGEAMRSLLQESSLPSMTRRAWGRAATAERRPQAAGHDSTGQPLRRGAG